MSTNPPMTVSRSAAARRALLAAVSLAACLDAINGTALGVSGGHVMGALHAGPDELAWLNIAYLAAKLTAFPFGAWACLRFGYRRSLPIATLAVAAAAFAAALAGGPAAQLLSRAIQGAGGAVVLVGGQALLFEIFPRRRQGLVQGTFALAAVMAPNALAPALQGWLGDDFSWTWIFLAELPLALLAVALLQRAAPAGRPAPDRRLDRPGLFLLTAAMLCITYVLVQGERWNWFEAPRIAMVAGLGAATLAAFAARQRRRQDRDPLIDFSVLHNADFTFGFVVSFVAGFALFGSATLIPTFAMAVLRFPPLDAGLLLLPSGALIAVGLLGAGWLIQSGRVNPFKLVPAGILLFMSAMWLLAGSSTASGFPDLAAPLLLRGLGLGILFITLTLVTLLDLDRAHLVHGVGLFDFGRQIGGLLGVAFVRTWLDHRAALHRVLLAAHLTPGNPVLAATRGRLAGTLAARGVNPWQAGAAALGLLQRSIHAQAATLSIDETFLALALLFVFASPFLIALKLVQKRFASPATAHSLPAVRQPHPQLKEQSS